MKLTLKQVRYLNPATGEDRITNVDVVSDIAGEDQTRDASGLWLMPGVVDIAARLREPGASQKATVASEAKAALACGITTVVMPPDTKPVVDSSPVVDRIHRMAEAAGGAKVRVLGALTQGLKGEALAEYPSLKSAGVVGLSNGQSPVANWLVARRALEYAKGLGMTVHIQGWDAALANGGCAHEGPTATRLGLPGIPVAAEVANIRAWISLVEDTGASVHFGRLSAARSVGLVEAAQLRGLPITADVAIHQLFLTDSALQDFDPMAHVLPPLRSVEDMAALRDGVRRGVIGALVSDHQPHEADAKVNPFPMTEPGISGLDTLLPLGIALVQDGMLSPLQLAQRLCATPRGLLGQQAVDNDWILVAPQQPWQLDHLQSAGQNSPLLGTVLPGRCIQSFQQVALHAHGAHSDR